MYRRQYGLDVISLMPANLYGPNDSYDSESSHVLPALLRKIHEAKLWNSETVTLWGSGAPRREFLFVDDLADAIVFLAESYQGEQHVNVGTGLDISILELAEMIAGIVGWHGRFEFDFSRPDGVPRKQLDVSLLGNLGWRASTELGDGITRTYRSYIEARH